MDIGVRPSLIRWFATYLQGRRQMCTFRNQKSECKSLKGGIPQGSALGPLAFIVKINQLANVVKTPSDDQNAGSNQEDIVIFMDDTGGGSSISIDRCMLCGIKCIVSPEATPERRRRKLSRGVRGHAPRENFEI